MSWLVRWQDTEINSDDFLIEDLEQIEKATSTPWSIANPLRDIKVAKAFLAVAMLRAGKSDTQITVALNAVTLRTLKSTFEYQPDDDASGGGNEEGGGPLDRPRRTSPGSSRGRAVKGGSRPIPADSESETFSPSSEKKPA